jgi:type III secretory pathway component EscU
MYRKDNAVEVCVCLLAVAGFVTAAVVADSGVHRIMGFVMTAIFLMIAIVYSIQEEKHRRMHLKMLNSEITDEVVENYKDEQPYYGMCNCEYLEGIDEGAKWLRDKLKG